MTRQRMKWAAFGLVMTLGLAPGWAAGDVIPPDVDACQGRQVGAACGGSLGTPAGHCQQSTCTRINYAGWDRDASATPPSMEYACVRCIGSTGPTDSGPTDGSTTTTPSPSSNGCSVGSTAMGRRVGPWLLAGLVGAAFLVRRRRDA